MDLVVIVPLIVAVNISFLCPTLNGILDLLLKRRAIEPESVTDRPSLLRAGRVEEDLQVRQSPSRVTRSLKRLENVELFTVEHLRLFPPCWKFKILMLA